MCNSTDLTWQEEGERLPVIFAQRYWDNSEAGLRPELPSGSPSSHVHLRIIRTADIHFLS